MKMDIILFENRPIMKDSKAVIDKDGKQLCYNDNCKSIKCL